MKQTSIRIGHTLHDVILRGTSTHLDITCINAHFRRYGRARVVSTLRVEISTTCPVDNRKQPQLAGAGVAQCARANWGEKTSGSVSILFSFGFKPGK